MICSFYSISTFRNSVTDLCKKEKYGYYQCRLDICNTFKNLNFEDIWEKNYLIKDLDNIRIIKIRISNSFQNFSSADGFRLIICCNRKFKAINFLNIYPKRGKLAKLDQPSAEYKRQLNEYASGLKEGRLVEHNIEDELKIKPPDK